MLPEGALLPPAQPAFPLPAHLRPRLLPDAQPSEVLGSIPLWSPTVIPPVWGMGLGTAISCSETLCRPLCLGASLPWLVSSPALELPSCLSQGPTAPSLGWRGSPGHCGQEVGLGQQFSFLLGGPTFQDAFVGSSSVGLGRGRMAAG